MTGTEREHVIYRYISRKNHISKSHRRITQRRQTVQSLKSVDGRTFHRATTNSKGTFFIANRFRFHYFLFSKFNLRSAGLSMIMQIRSQCDDSFHPEVRPLQHALPERHLPTSRVHPIYCFAVIFT